MKAVVFHEHGSSEVLGYEDMPVPEPGVVEVLLAVRAVSVNHGPDVETRRKGFGEQSRHAVGRAAGREWDNQFDRLCGPVLRP